MVGGDSVVSSARDDGSTAFAQRSSFTKQKGLAAPNGISFASVASPKMYLRHVDGVLRLDKVTAESDRASATFLVS